MNLGYFTMPLHPPGRDYVETLREDREAIVLADALGFTEAFVGEHVTDVAESVTDCCVFLASLAPVTKRITLGTGTINLPNGHPAAIAAKVAMLDNLLEGRFVFGISPGGLPSDWEVFGNLDVDRRAKFLECIEHILGLWAGEAPYDLAGEHWNISTARTMIPEIGQGVLVKPYQKPHPPIAVTVVEPPREARRRPRSAGGTSSPPTSCCHPGYGRTGTRTPRRRPPTRRPIRRGGELRRRCSSPTTTAPRVSTASGPRARTGTTTPSSASSSSAPAGPTSSRPTLRSPTPPSPPTRSSSSS